MITEALKIDFSSTVDQVNEINAEVKVITDDKKVSSRPTKSKAVDSHKQKSR